MNQPFATDTSLPLNITYKFSDWYRRIATSFNCFKTQTFYAMFFMERDAILSTTAQWGSSLLLGAQKTTPDHNVIDDV